MVVRGSRAADDVLNEDIMNKSDGPDGGQGQAERYGLFRMHPGPQDVYNHFDFDAE